MKKSISLLISLVLIVVTIGCVFVGSVTANSTNDYTSYFENPENWGFTGGGNNGNFTTQTIGSNAASTWVSADTESITVNSEQVSALALNSVNHMAHIYLPNIKSDTDYSLSFRYYSTAAVVNNAAGIFRNIGIYASDVEGASFEWNKKGFIENISYNGSYSKDANWLTTWNKYAYTNTTKPAADTWYTLTFTFNSRNYTNLALAFVTNTNGLTYLDDFSFTAYNSVSVENGSANYSTAASGTTVTLTPAAAETGKQFSHWEVVSGGVTLSSTTAENATFVMPYEPVSVKAVYDYTLNDPEAGADRVIDIKGNSIRKQAGDLPQGLRYKFYMDNGFETLYDGYTVSKVGLLTLPSDYLQGNALIHQTYTYGGSNYAPIDKEVLAENYQYESGDTTNTYFTAALTNIAKEDYDLNYSVRAYTVYKHTDGTEITVYGAEVSANVFAVVYEILTTSEDASDIAAAEAAIADCGAEYDAWVAANRVTNPVD